MVVFFFFISEQNNWQLTTEKEESNVMIKSRLSPEDQSPPKGYTTIPEEIFFFNHDIWWQDSTVIWIHIFPKDLVLKWNYSKHLSVSIDYEWCALVSSCVNALEQCWLEWPLQGGMVWKTSCCHGTSPHCWCNQKEQHPMINNLKIGKLPLPCTSTVLLKVVEPGEFLCKWV